MLVPIPVDRTAIGWGEQIRDVERRLTLATAGAHLFDVSWPGEDWPEIRGMALGLAYFALGIARGPYSADPHFPDAEAADVERLRLLRPAWEAWAGSAIRRALGVILDARTASEADIPDVFGRIAAQRLPGDLAIDAEALIPHAARIAAWLRRCAPGRGGRNTITPHGMLARLVILTDGRDPDVSRRELKNLSNDIDRRKNARLK